MDNDYVYDRRKKVKKTITDRKDTSFQITQSSTRDMDVLTKWSIEETEFHTFNRQDSER